MKPTITIALISMCGASLENMNGVQSVADSLTKSVGFNSLLEGGELDELEETVSEDKISVLEEAEAEAQEVFELKEKSKKNSYDEETENSSEGSLDEFTDGETYHNKNGIILHKGTGKMSYYGGKMNHRRGKHNKKDYGSDSSSGSESDSNSGSGSDSDYSSNSESEGEYHSRRPSYNKKGKYDAYKPKKRGDWKKNLYCGDWSDEHDSSDDNNYTDYSNRNVVNKNPWDGRMSHKGDKGGYRASKDYWSGHNGYMSDIAGYSGHKNPWDGHNSRRSIYIGDKGPWEGHNDYTNDRLMGKYSKANQVYRRDFYSDGPWNMGIKNYRRDYYNTRANLSPNYNY